MRNQKKKKSTTNRTSLGRQIGKEIQLDAEFDAIGRPTYGDQSKTTILFRDVRFSGNPAADHIWIDEAAIVNRGAFGRFCRGVRYIFKGTPYSYISSFRGHLCEKYSIKNISLIGIKPASA
jgi:hypothetical protein